MRIIHGARTELGADLGQNLIAARRIAAGQSLNRFGVTNLIHTDVEFERQQTFERQAQIIRSI